MTRAILTVHGFVTDSNDFAPLYPYFGAVYDRVEKFCAPGHGEPKDLKEFEAQPTIDSLLRQFDALKKEYDRVDVIGFSMGGVLSSYLASCREVSRLVLLAPANKYMNPGGMARHIAFLIDRYFKAYSAAEGTGSEKSRTAVEKVQPYVNNNKMALKIVKDTFFPRYNYHSVTTFMRLVNICNASITKITCPTMIIWGRLDELVPQKTIDFVSAYCTNSTSLILPDIGHLMLYSENWRAVAEPAVEFLCGKTIEELDALL